MSPLDMDQLRRSAATVAAEAIARGYGDDATNDDIVHYLLTYSPDSLTLGQLRAIAADAFRTAVTAAKVD